MYAVILDIGIFYVKILNILRMHKLKFTWQLSGNHRLSSENYSKNYSQITNSFNYNI